MRSVSIAMVLLFLAPGASALLGLGDEGPLIGIEALGPVEDLADPIAYPVLGPVPQAPVVGPVLGSVDQTFEPVGPSVNQVVPPLPADVSLASEAPIVSVALTPLAPASSGTVQSPGSSAAAAPQPPSAPSDGASAEEPYKSPPAEVGLVVAAASLVSVGSVAASMRADLAFRALGRVAKWMAAVPVFVLFSRIDDDRLKDHPVRARILQYLETHPGASMQELHEAMEVAWGTTVYHLGRLEKSRHLVSHQDGRFHRYWLEADPEARKREVASLLKLDTPRRIVEVVNIEPGIHQRGLCERLEILPATASKYLKRLVAGGVVTVTPDRRRQLYYPAA